MTYANQAVVRIVKGKSEGTATQQAFEKVWEPLGWRIDEDKPKSKTKPKRGLTNKDTSSEASNNNDDKKEEAK